MSVLSVLSTLTTETSMTMASVMTMATRMTLAIMRKLEALSDGWFILAIWKHILSIFANTVGRECKLDLTRCLRAL